MCSPPLSVQVIKGTYLQTNQLQGFNALAPSASQNLSSHLAGAIGAAQVPSSSINEALASAAMPGMTAEVCAPASTLQSCIFTCVHGGVCLPHGPVITLASAL